MEHGFGSYHPAVNLFFFIGAAAFGMFFAHPAFVTLSVFLSLGSYFMIRGKKGVRFLVWALVLFVVIVLLNPVFNTLGSTVLFTWLWERPYTLEALFYGFATGGMFLTVILWFACYNEIMTEDKFTYLFGRAIPSISLVLCMVLRFVPHFQDKAEMAANARKCVGMAPDNGTKQEKLTHGMSILSVLTSWALEGAAMTADSMKSRGYGSGTRTHFSIYRATGRDRALCALMIACGGGLIVCALLGGTGAQFLPVFWAPNVGGATICGLICYGMFLTIPLAINLWEGITWRILRSKI